MKTPQLPPLDAIEVRRFKFDVQKDSAATELRGYAAVFNQITEILPGIFERIRSGAFAKTIVENDIAAVWNHNSDIVLGRNRNNTLRLKEDEHGLGVEIDPPDTALVRDMAIAPIKRGDVSGMSFKFLSVRRPEIEARADGSILITQIEVRLFEVSPTTLPAYKGTEISARSSEWIDEFQQQRQAEIQSAPGLAAHPEPAQPEATPEIVDHPEESAPVEMRHLDEGLFNCLEVVRRDPRAAV